MKEFLYKSLIIALPVLFLIITVNYFGDPAKLFDKDYEKEMSEIIMAGNFVTNISNYDNRIFQKELINRMNSAPELLVLGSSRTMQINSTYFPDYSFFNSSVSGASIEDIVALFQIYKERNILPKKIIIGIDPWLLNENNGQTRWKSLEFYYNKYNQQNYWSVSTRYLENFGELLSLSYFQASIEAIPGKFSSSSRPMATRQKLNRTNTKLTDGSLVYAEGFTNATQDQINAKIDSYINSKVYSIEGFESISDDIWSEFKDFIDALKRENITVEFFLSPYAPIVYDKILKDYPNVVNTENLVVSFAKANGIKVFGSFDPYSLGFDETYFYDGMHCKEKGVMEILNVN